MSAQNGTLLINYGEVWVCFFLYKYMMKSFKQGGKIHILEIKKTSMKIGNSCVMDCLDTNIDM